MEKKQRDNRSYWSNQGTKILKRGKIIKMYQNLFPVKTVSFVNLPVFWENKCFCHSSLHNVASYFVAEVLCSGRREKRKFSSLLKANSSGRSSEIAKI